MKEQAPGMFASLSASGQLDAARDERVAMFEDQTSSAVSEAAAQHLTTSNKASPEERAQLIDQMLRQASEIALSQVLEFPQSESPSYPAE
jgi:hypothetical protein